MSDLNSNIKPRLVSTGQGFSILNTVEYKDDHLSIVSDKGKNNIVEVLNLLQSEGIIYKRVYSELPTLNDVFLELTGKQLRD